MMTPYAWKSDMPYTQHDTPEVIDRIERDLDIVIQVVTDADPALRSLVLTGGFARGEGAVLNGEPQNDYDLIAIRGRGRPRVPYDYLGNDLADRLGLHIDLAPVAAWRLPFVSRSIFWYETAWRGQVLWGEDLLKRIPIRQAHLIQPTEGLRLLVNRAAGLLFATETNDAHEYRLQAAKALLAVFDVHMLTSGTFPPSQSERWTMYQTLHAAGSAPPALETWRRAIEWAYRFKMDPASVAPEEPDAAWREARQAILEAVPTALYHARIPSLDAYARHDGLLDQVYYQFHARSVPGAARLLRHPTGRVRVATLRLLEATPDARVRPERAMHCLGGLSVDLREPLTLLQGLRGATLQ